ncbi:GlsB/YeaQ/YmgE family stress response membrane protein [Merismopedia glauca]|uniref:GlsB/YeaQ/YmgE family stress response membrane protein n=1 Tax=Merismopedia glauca CCAP 1448/3 TaxID=1296344 RepID=A0A2T1C4C7_9CYAN|nr:GlsB/YeaQ/YmgE family stress response membrane protein [Merismopedia glauca]PSB03008.1 GlsB/YeaQ/YmgE family stress response membrane protein [Merismopedia glauca CCAP 1448/3]
MWNLIAWAILGIIAGAIGKAIYPGTQGGGILATMVLGIVGAFIGGTLFSFLGGGGLNIAASAALSIPSIAVAVVGAMIAIFLWGLITRSSSV